MAARVQIIVEAKDASSGVLRAITGQLGAFGGLIEELTSKNINMGNLTERAATLMVDSFRDVIDTTQQYAQEVRDLSLASGQSAEASSRLLQVLDDYQLTAEDAKAATKALTREGLAPTLDTIAQISEEYNRLNNVEEKNALVQKKLGRASQEWLNLLSQGPDKIRALNKAVDEKLILTEKDIQASEEYRLALDEWNDSVQATKISIGRDLLPVLTELLEKNRAGGEAVREEVKWWEYAIPLVGSLHATIVGLTAEEENNTSALQGNSAALDQNTMSLKEAAEAEKAAAEEAKRTTQYYQGLIGAIQGAQSELDRYEETNANLTAKQKELNAELETATKRYGANSQKVKDIKADLADLDKELQDNEAAHRRWAAQTVFSFAMARAAADGSITKGEGEMLIQIGEQLDLYDKKTADTMRSVNDAFDSLDTSNAQDTVKTLEGSLYRLTGKKWVIKIVTDTSGVNLPEDNNAGMPDYYQSGGQVYAGRPVVVGEGGAEPFIPSVNGRILGHAESLHALSLGGSNNYFYGNVTISPDSQGGGDLLNVR